MTTLSPCINSQRCHMWWGQQWPITQTLLKVEGCRVSGMRTLQTPFLGSSFISLWCPDLTCFLHLPLLLNPRFFSMTLALVFVDSLLTRHTLFQSERDFSFLWIFATQPKSMFFLHLISLLAQTWYHPCSLRSSNVQPYIHVKSAMCNTGSSDLIQEIYIQLEFHHSCQHILHTDASQNGSCFSFFFIQLHILTGHLSTSNKAGA